MNEELKLAKKQYQLELKRILSRISMVEKIVLCHLLKKRYESHSIPVLKTHRDKLLELWKSQRTLSPRCLMNLSKVKLSLLQENALRLGMKNHILPRKVDEEALKMEFEKVVSSISNDLNVSINCEFREKLKGLIKSYVSEANAVCGNK